MSRRPLRFTEADLRRAKKVAGTDMAVEVLPDGTIRLSPLRGAGLEGQETAIFDPREPMVF